MTIDYCGVLMDEEGLTFLPRAVEGIFDASMPCQPLPFRRWVKVVDTGAPLWN
jgi:hypothetical protein